MILERLKPDLDTPEKIREAYSIFSSYLFSNFIFFFVIFLAVYTSYRLKSVLGTNSFLIIVIFSDDFAVYLKEIGKRAPKRPLG